MTSDNEKKWLETFNEITTSGSEKIENFLKEARELYCKEIQNYYKWLFSIVTLSSAIFGVSVSSLGGKGMIANKMCFYAGIFLLFVNVVLGVWVLKKKIEYNINGLIETHSFIREYLYGGKDHVWDAIKKSNGDNETSSNAILNFLKKRINLCEKGHKQANEYNINKKKDYTADVMLWIFIFAVILVFISIIPNLTNDNIVMFLRNFLYTKCRYL